MFKRFILLVLGTPYIDPETIVVKEGYIEGLMSCNIDEYSEEVK